MASTCRCGEPVTSALYLRYRYPRAECLPVAADPWYVHGGAPMATCGAPGCEAEVYAALASEHPGTEIHVYTEPPAGIFIVGQDDAP